MGTDRMERVLMHRVNVLVDKKRLSNMPLSI